MGLTAHTFFWFGMCYLGCEGVEVFIPRHVEK